MNIKKALNTLAMWRQKTNYPSYDILECIIKALDEPIDPPRKSPFDDYHYCQGWDKAIKEHCIPKEKEIKQLTADLANANKCNEKLVFDYDIDMSTLKKEIEIKQNQIDFRDKEIEILESKLRVEGYRNEVKDGEINHLKTVLKVNGIKLEN